MKSDSGPKLRYIIIFHKFASRTVDHYYNPIQMQYCFYILFNVVLATMLFYSFVDPKKDYQRPPSDLACINEVGQTKIFCAQCVKRKNEELPSKGYLVESQGKVSILKIKDSHDLSCKEFLQFANYQKSKSSSEAAQIENVGSISEILKEIRGIMSVGINEKEVISSQFNTFIIYRWFEKTQQKSTIVRFPNIDQVQAIQHIFLYVINGIILLFITLFFYNKNSFSHLKPKNMVIVSIYFILIQALTSNIFSSLSLLPFVRIVFFTMLLMRIDTNKMIIAISFVIGLATNFFSVIYLPYLFFVIAAIFSRGKNDQNMKEIWSYIILSLLIYATNQVWWEHEYAYIADNHCRLIELSILTLTPLGLLLIRDAKYVGFDLYKPNEQKRHSISLSGFEEEEEDDESGI